MVVEAADIDNEPGAPGPGAVLRAERERAGKNLEEIARDTRITINRLRALEDDDYDRVGSKIFIVGYIRQYAKWLHLDADELVSQYQAIQPGAAQPPAAAEQQRAHESVQVRPLQQLPLLWLVILVLVVWVLVTLFLQPPHEQHATDPAQPVPGVNEAAEREVLPALPSESPATAPLTQDDRGPQEAGKTGTAAGAEAPQTQPEEPVAAEGTPGAADVLTMAFTGECWVEVRDADDDLLFAQLQQDGDNLRLTGEAPFAILLGNARAADLEVNGRQINTDPGPNRNTLRLTIEP